MHASRTFELAEPPRGVPAALRLKVIFGTVEAQVAWAVLGVGMIFFWGFAMNADVASWYLFRGPLEKATAIIEAFDKTSFSEGGSKHHKGTPVYAVRDRFSAEGTEYRGVSYQTGSAWEGRTRATVEYPRGRPRVSRIVGLRPTPLGPMAASAAALPLVGLGIVVWTLRRGMRAVRLLRHGRPALAALKSRVATNASVNEKTVYKLTFEFVDADGVTHAHVVKTHQPEQLEDEEKERLLYDPSNPARAFAVDALPGRPQINESGGLVGESAARGLLSLVIPVASVAGHAANAYLAYSA
jgi:hypothetical protein